MNVRRVLAVFMVVAGLLFVLSAVSAQDEMPSAGYYLLNGTSGTLEDNGDGTYALTLQEVPTTVFYLSTSDAPFVSSVATKSLAAWWAANPEPVDVQALLSSGDVLADVTISAPTFDDLFGEFTATVTVNSIEDLAAEEGATADVPESFEIAGLAIVANADFEAGLGAGATALGEDARAFRRCSGCK